MIVVCTTLLTLADTLILHSVFNMEMNSICYYNNVYNRQYCFNILKSNSTKLLHMRSTKPVLSYTNTSTKVKPFSILAYSVDLLHVSFFYFSLALYIHIILLHFTHFEHLLFALEYRFNAEH